jgi:hypothetical protein
MLSTSFFWLKSDLFSSTTHHAHATLIRQLGSILPGRLCALSDQTPTAPTMTDAKKLATMIDAKKLTMLIDAKKLTTMIDAKKLT